MTADRETTLIECMECGKQQTHRVCAECFAGRMTTRSTGMPHIGPTGGRCNFCGTRLDSASRGRACPSSPQEPFVTPCWCGEGYEVPWNDHEQNCPWFITEGVSR